MIKVWRTLKGNKIRFALEASHKSCLRVQYMFIFPKVHAGVQNTSAVQHRTGREQYTISKTKLPILHAALYSSVLPCVHLHSRQHNLKYCTALHRTILEHCTVLCLFILVAVQQRRALALHVRDAAPQGPALDRRHGRPRRRGRWTGTRWAPQQYTRRAGTRTDRTTRATRAAQ